MIVHEVLVQGLEHPKKSYIAICIGESMRLWKLGFPGEFALSTVGSKTRRVLTQVLCVCPTWHDRPCCSWLHCYTKHLLSILKRPPRLESVTKGSSCSESLLEREKRASVWRGNSSYMHCKLHLGADANQLLLDVALCTILVQRHVAVAMLSESYLKYQQHVEVNQ